MIRRLIVVLTVLVTITSVATAQDASAAWDSVCSQYNFQATVNVGTLTTFAQAYQGGNFAADFEAILNKVAELMNTEPPDADGNDLVRATLTDWPAV